MPSTASERPLCEAFGLVVACTQTARPVHFPPQASVAGMWVGTNGACLHERVDNDGDSLVDDQDPDCALAGSTSEWHPACSDGVDNDDDGWTDMEDPNCATGADIMEHSRCRDGRDNDGDGLWDLADPDCVGATDDTEWLSLPTRTGAPSRTGACADRCAFLACWMRVTGARMEAVMVDNSLGVLAAQSQALADLVEQAGPGVVGVHSGRRWGGSGVVWNTEGVIVTAAHVLGDEDKVTVTRADGTDVDAHVVGMDPGRDVAVLRAPNAGLVPLRQGKAEGARVGNLALSLARPGKSVRARLGVLSAVAKGWTTPRGGKVDRYLETDAGRAPGFSGGPLLDVGGAMLGMNTAGLMRMSTVAIPVATLQHVVDEVLAHGRMRKAWLGVAMQPTRLRNPPPEVAQHNLGLLLTHVEADSPAHKAGLLVGDILLSLGHEGVQTLEELNALFTSEHIGATLDMRFLRGGELRKVPVTLAAH